MKAERRGKKATAFTVGGSAKLVTAQPVVSPAQVCSISGTVYHDVNGDGVRQPAEPPKGGVQVFLDANNNGVFNAGERTTLSNAAGGYFFGGLPERYFAIAAARASRPCLEPLEPRRLLAMITIYLGSLGDEDVITGPNAATDINASGQVVGKSAGRAFFWQNGVMTDLGTLGGNYSAALGLNDLGQVAGYSQTSSINSSRAFLITPEDTDGNGTPDRWYRDTNADGKNDLMRDLGTLGSTYTQAIAYDVNNSGQVVGYSEVVYPRVPAQHAFRWQNGVMTDLGTFGGTSSRANTINDAGQVGGQFYTSNGPHAFLWKNGVGTDLGNSSSGVTDITAAGRLVDASRVWTPTVPNGSSGTFATLGQLPRADQDPDHSVGRARRAVDQQRGASRRESTGNLLPL